jgi:heme exporter protein D
MHEVVRDVVAELRSPQDIVAALNMAAQRLLRLGFTNLGPFDGLANATSIAWDRSERLAACRRDVLSFMRSFIDQLQGPGKRAEAVSLIVLVAGILGRVRERERELAEKARQPARERASKMTQTTVESSPKP